MAATPTATSVATSISVATTATAMAALFDDWGAALGEEDGLDIVVVITPGAI